MSGIVESVNTGRVVEVPWGKLKRSGIDKRPVAGVVTVGRLGLDGDEIADEVHHGGEAKAVYAYAVEDLERWSDHLGRPLEAGQFGENLTVRGLDLTGARIGQRWEVGSLMLEVTGPRIPCAVFQGHLGERQWVKRFAAAGLPGAYLRVLAPGRVGAGDTVVVTHSGSGPTVLERFRETMPLAASSV